MNPSTLRNSGLALEEPQKQGPADSPGSPDESLNSVVFIVKQATHEESTTSTRILE